jgi:hypothetical protein
MGATELKGRSETNELPVLLSVAGEHETTWHRERPHIKIEMRADVEPYGSITLRVDPTGHLDAEGQAAAQALFQDLWDRDDVYDLNQLTDQDSVWPEGFCFDGIIVTHMPAILERIQVFARAWTRPGPKPTEERPGQFLRRYLRTL